MCKSLLYRGLFVLLLGFVASAIGAQETSLFQSRSLDIDDQFAKGLYHQALYQSDPYRDLYPTNAIDRQRLVGLLHMRYPEMAHALEQAPEQTISGKEVSELLVQILKEETAAQVMTAEDPLWKVTEETQLPRDQEVVFQFLYAYEMFKDKRFAEADKIFDEIVKYRQGEYEYAYYYSGLIALIQGDYQRAHDRLKKVGKDDILKKESPYYLAVAHYGLKNYDELVRYYEPRIREMDLPHRNEIAKLVAFAQFQKGNFNEAIAALNVVNSIRDLSIKENYVYGTSLSKLGKSSEAQQYLQNVASVESELAKNAQYQQALNHAADGNTRMAIQKFEELLAAKSYDPDEIKYNLALLHGREKNFDQLAQYCVELLPTKKNTQAHQLLAKSLGQISDDALYKKVVRKVNINTTDKKTLAPSIYQRALASLQRGDKRTANEYFDLLAEVDPLVEERGTAAAWKGIMAYEEGDYKNAIRLLSNYNKSLRVDHKARQLEFDTNYFLAYSYYRTKQHGKALGYFSNALAILNQNNVAIARTTDKSNDLHLRMGDCYFLTDQYASAARSYQYVIDHGSTKSDYAMWQNATIAELQGEPYDQIILLEDMMEQYPNSKYVNRSKFAIANALFSVSKFDQAAKYYQDLERSTTGRIKYESIMQLGLISVNAGSYEQAEQYFKKIVASTNTDQDLIVQSKEALRDIYKDYTNDTDAYLALVDDGGQGNVTKAKALYDLATSNYADGNVDVAVEQWTKYINEYPSSASADAARFALGDIALGKQQYKIAIAHYTALQPGFAKATEGYKKAEAIAYTQLKDEALYVKLMADRKSKMPQLPFTQDEQYKLYKSYTLLDDTGQMIVFGEALLQDQSLPESVKREVLGTISQTLADDKDWQKLITLYAAQKNIVNQKPKFIYQRALALMNTDQLDAAALAVTDHYDTLIEEPAWLAKGILLVADVFVAQGDNDSAEAALEALISTDSDVPPSLIAQAKKKLKELNPSN